LLVLGLGLGFGLRYQSIRKEREGVWEDELAQGVELSTGPGCAHLPVVLHSLPRSQARSQSLLFLVVGFSPLTPQFPSTLSILFSISIFPLIIIIICYYSYLLLML